MFKNSYKYALGGLVTLFIVGNAHAADPVPASKEEVPPATFADRWSGLYLGVHGGFSQTDTSGVFDTSGSSPYATYSIMDIDGGHYGIQGGYNFNYNGLIFGVEADYSWSNIGGSVIDGEDDLQTVDTDYFGTIRGRFGASTNDLLVYMTGGYGFTKTSLSFENGADSLSIKSHGFVYGAGLEYAIAPGITVKGEWIRMALDDNLLSSDQLGGSGGLLDAVSDGDDDDHFSLSGIDIFRVGLNFQLGAFGNSGGTQQYALQGDSSATDFSGFYVGGHAGYANADVGGQFDEGGATPLANFALYDMGGLAGGVQAGYNFQTGKMVYGVEADYTWLDSRDSFVDGDDDLQELAVNHYGTVRGRFGVVANSLLVFVTGGFAWSELDLRVENGTDGLMLNSHGYVYGGGVEWALSENLSLKAEYQRIDFDDGIGAADNSALDDLSDGDDGDHLAFDGIDVVRAGLVLRF